MRPLLTYLPAPWYIFIIDHNIFVACPNGRYGKNCKDECFCNDSPCNQDTGECDCNSGKTGDACQLGKK